LIVFSLYVIVEKRREGWEMPKYNSEIIGVVWGWGKKNEFWEGGGGIGE
jgi:hypothetical protein